MRAGTHGPVVAEQSAESIVEILQTVESVIEYFDAEVAVRPASRWEVPQRPGPDRASEIDRLARCVPRMPDSWLELARKVLLLDRACGAAELGPFTVAYDLTTSLLHAHQPGVTPYWPRDVEDEVLWVASYESSFVYVAARDSSKYRPGEILYRFLGPRDAPLERMNSSMTQFLLITANIFAHGVEQSAAGIDDWDTDVLETLVAQFTDDPEQLETWRTALGLRRK